MATIYVSLDAGESKDVPAVWYANSSGAKTLNCKVSIPSFFNSLADDLTSVAGTDSDAVSFKLAEDREDAPIILYSAIVIVIIIGTLIFTRVSANKLNAVNESEELDGEEEVSNVPE